MAAQTPPTITLPKPLPAWRVALYTVLFPICLTAVVTASVGLYVLTDYDKSTWIANTQFGDLWRRLMVWNPMTSNLMFNGGIIGSIISFAQLRRHRQGKLLRNVQVMRSDEVEQARKKDVKKRR